MSLLVILMLSGLVSVFSQCTLLDSQCDNECRNDVELQRVFAMMENMRRDMIKMEKSANETNERLEKKIMDFLDMIEDLSHKNEVFENRVVELESKDAELTDENMKTDTRIKHLEGEVQNQNATINQLQILVSELKSKNQTSNVDSSMNYDCDDLRARGYLYSRVYEVNVNNVETRRVYCEMTSDGQAWTRILHRQDNLTDFTSKEWADYEAGFGDPQGSHWMGLVGMHQLTTSQEYKMRVDLMDWEEEKRFAEYTNFRVGPGSNRYRLSIGGYSGTAGDSMTHAHNNMLFTTIDQDNDTWPYGNCADGTRYNTGGWWYNNCFFARLTGHYLEGGERVPYRQGIQWYHWRGVYYSYKVATMKIQRL